MDQYIDAVALNLVT